MKILTNELSEIITQINRRKREKSPAKLNVYFKLKKTSNEMFMPIVIIINKITGFPLFTLPTSNLPTYFILIIFFSFSCLRTWIFRNWNNSTRSRSLAVKIFLFSLFSLRYFGFCIFSNWTNMHLYGFVMCLRAWKALTFNVIIKNNQPRCRFSLFLDFLHFFTSIQTFGCVKRDKQP